MMVPSWTEAVARFLVARFLNRYICVGSLTLLEDGGSTLSFGDSSNKCHVKSVLRVHDPIFYWKIFIANRDAPKSSSSIFSKSGRGWWTPMLLTAGVSSAKYFLRHVSRNNSVTQTRRNISQHYDLSNDFFSLFLDKSMTYSCGIFKTGDESLEAAQLHKLSLLIDKAKVERDHQVLDIGSGWGSLAIQVVKQTGCKYTGITLSEEQLKYAQKKVKEAGLEDHITFLLCDYREIPARKYDRIISCEMIEHVGHEYMDEFFTCCKSHLTEDGIFVLQAEDAEKKKISIPNLAYEAWITKDQNVVSFLVNSLSEDVLPQVFGLAHAADVWRALKELYSSQSKSRVSTLRGALTNTKKLDMTTQQYISKMKGFASELSAAGKPVDEDELKDYMLNGLDGTFNPLVAAINVVPSTSLSDMCSQLLAAENRDNMLQSTGQVPGSFTSSVNAVARFPNPSYGGGSPRPHMPPPPSYAPAYAPTQYPQPPQPSYAPPPPSYAPTYPPTPYQPQPYTPHPPYYNPYQPPLLPYPTTPAYPTPPLTRV